MLKRYTKPALGKIWDDQEKFKRWLEAELAFLGARASVGEILACDYREIAKYASFDLEVIEVLESSMRHDLQAFLASVRRFLTAAGLPDRVIAELHRKLTSYDVEDPALIKQMRDAIAEVVTELGNLRREVLKQAFRHKRTLMISRTHGQNAKPDTFGRLLLVYVEAIDRCIHRLETCLVDELSEGRIGGAVGNFYNLDPVLAKAALEQLGLQQARAESQIMQRDRHAVVITSIAIAGGVLEQIAKTFWIMAHSGIEELEEPFRSGQRGSSAMAGKKNPIGLEQIWGLARMLRAYSSVALENIATFECRDISQSSAERHIIPGATTLLHFMTCSMTAIVRDLVVYTARMTLNFKASNETWADQDLCEALMSCAVDYDSAYTYVQQLCFQARRENTPLSELVRRVPMTDIMQQQKLLHVVGQANFDSVFDFWAKLNPGLEYLFGQYEEPQD